MNTIYLVSYYGGGFDDTYSEIIFATMSKSKATKYVTKFNRILKKWKQYYSQFEEDRKYYHWIKEEHIEQHYSRWSKLRNIGRCYCKKISLR